MRKARQRQTSVEFVEPNRKSSEDLQEKEANKLTHEIIHLALMQKSLDTVAFDVSQTSSIARNIVIASGTSPRHVKGICDRIKDGLKASGTEPLRVDGYDSGEWVVMDFEDVIVHLFFEPKRQYYRFDDLMVDSDKIELDEDLRDQVRQFKTGLHAL